MREIIDFIKENWGLLSSGSFGLLWVIVRLTPSKKDDRILKFLQRFFNFFIPDRKKKKKHLSM